MNRLIGILSGRRRDLPARVLRAAAHAAEPFYAATVALRNAAFNTGLTSSRRAHCPVISVGNLTTGGTGKTPMTVRLVAVLTDLGARPAVILRGYMADPAGLSDEQRELADALPDVPVIAQPDRLAAAAVIQQRFPQVDVIVLDDGFQHRRIARNLDLVLIDATNPFGYGHLLPRGLMRESPRALRRADAVIVTHADALDPADRAKLDRRIAEYHGRAPLAHAAHRWTAILDHHDQPVSPAELAGGPAVLAFCGIGNPQSFFDQADRQLNLVARQAFDDHFHYDRTTLRRLVEQARRDNAAALLTTAKDWVKLRRLLESNPVDVDLPVWRPRLTLELLDGEPALRQRLEQTLRP